MFTFEQILIENNNSICLEKLVKYIGKPILIRQYIC